MKINQELNERNRKNQNKEIENQHRSSKIIKEHFLKEPTL